MARRQCSKRGALRAEIAGMEKLSNSFSCKRLGLEKRNHFLENRSVAGGPHVMGSHKRQPKQIVGNPGADAGAGFGMPPMLDVAFHELPRGGAQDLFARDLRRGMNQGHDILKLIAKSVSAARLIKGRAAPDAAA